MSKHYRFWSDGDTQDIAVDTVQRWSEGQGPIQIANEVDPADLAAIGAARAKRLLQTIRMIGPALEQGAIAPEDLTDLLQAPVDELRQLFMAIHALGNPSYTADPISD